MNAPSSSPLIRKLLASAPTAEYGDAINLYGFLPGSWETDGVLHRPDGGRVEKRGEIHAGWILEGRAIQDVWLLADSFYGTTLRIYDPRQNAWHIHWHDTLKQYYPRQIGKAEGPDIVQLGHRSTRCRRGGCQPRSRRIRFTGLRISPPTRARAGNRRSTYSRGA